MSFGHKYSQICAAHMAQEGACFANESVPTAVEFMEEGHFLTLRNAKIDMYKGSMRLAVNKWGVIERASEQSDFTVNVSLQSSAMTLK